MPSLHPYLDAAAAHPELKRDVLGYLDGVSSERVDIEAELDEQRDGVRCSCRSPNDKAGSLLARE